MTRKRKSQIRYRRPYTTKIIHDIQQTEKQQKYHIENEEVKKQAILKAIKEKDIDTLRQFGKDHGFIHNNLRKKAWPLLLHCTLTNKKNKITTYKSRKHKDEEQVFLDIKRSFNTFPKDLDERRKKVLQLELNQVIVQVLRSFPKLHYYQGFHDICTVFLLLFGQSNAIQLISHVALFHLSPNTDAMLDSLEPILKEIELLNTLYRLKNEKLYNHFQSIGVLPYYCLSWIITWFSHDLSDLEDIYRIFDLILSTHPMMPLYITASLVLLKYKPEQDIEDEDDDLDPSLLHHYLCKLPYQPNLEWEPILQYAIELFTTYSPLELQYHAQFGLSQVSSFNTFHQHYLFYSSTTMNNNNMELSEKDQYKNNNDLYNNRNQQDDDDDDDGSMSLIKENKKVEKWIQQAYDILTMDPMERNQSINMGKQNSINSPSTITTNGGMPLWMMIGAVGLGTVAILLSMNQSPTDLLSSWP